MINEIKRKFARHEWLYTRHSADRSIERDIWSKEIEEAISSGVIIENYPEDKYGPSLLILGRTEDERPLHIQISSPRAGEKIKVITIYEPDLKNWKEGLKERKD